ncbi:MAG: IS1380 family transposase [Acidimicrobiales bacterium]
MSKPNKEGTFKVNTTRAAARVWVTADGQGIASHAGSLLVAELADRLGLTTGLSQAMAPVSRRRRRRDPGVVLTHLAVLLADGGDALSDLAVLRNEPELFGTVASDSTAFRLLHSGSCPEAIDEARRVARERAWAAGAGPASVTLDIDATLVESHTEKEDAAPTYKGGFGFSPMVCFVDETNEALAGVLRPGNASPFCAADHLEVLGRSIAQLPAAWRLGHEPGDEVPDVVHPVVVRTDSAGASHEFVEECLLRHCEVSIGMQVDERVRNALLMAQEEDRVPAIEADGSRRQGAWVTELTGLVDLSGWDESLRVISRRERPHPGAQLSLFDQAGEFRHQCFLTNSTGEVTALELRHRGHARVEDRIRCAKATGMDNLPFSSFAANEAWFALSLLAIDLMAWTAQLCLEGDLAKAEPKRLRYTLLHAAARVVHSARTIIVRFPATWPWGDDLLEAFERLRALPSG